MMTEAKLAKEARRKRRTPICVLIEQDGKDLAYFDKSKDLSEDGMFVETETPAKVGETLQLRFALPGSVPFTLGAQVTRVVPKRKFLFKSKQPGMGLRFVEIGEAVRQTIEAFVRRS